MMAQTVTICRTSFNLQEANYKQYKRLINDLRTRLNHETWKHGDIYLLRPHEPEPRTFFNVELVNENDVVTFRFRADDLYLVGYCIGRIVDRQREPGFDGMKWFEFKYEHGRPLIAGSTPLQFGHSYNDLEKNCGRSFVGLPITRDSLISNFKNFIKSPLENRYRATIMLQMVFLVSESIRFHIISHDIAMNLRKEGRVTEYHNLLVHSWVNLRNAIIKSDNSSITPGLITATVEKNVHLAIEEAKGLMAMMMPMPPE